MLIYYLNIHSSTLQVKKYYANDADDDSGGEMSLEEHYADADYADSDSDEQDIGAILEEDEDTIWVWGVPLGARRKTAPSGALEDDGDTRSGCSAMTDAGGWRNDAK